MPALSTCQQRSQSASASSSRRVVPNFRVSCCRPPLRASLGTRIVTMTSALPMSIPAARSQNSGSSSTSCITISYHEDAVTVARSEEHTSELQSPYDLVCRLLLEKKKKKKKKNKIKKKKKKKKKKKIIK